MTPDGRVGIGLIGCGYAAETLHLPALRFVPEARVVALADPRRGQVDAIADRFAVQGRHTDYRFLLDDPQIEAVGICAPTGLHAEMAAACLDAGKHVLIEKPVALKTEDVDALESRAAARRLVAAVGFNLRHNANILAARAIVGSGRIGSAVAMRSTWTSNLRNGLGMPTWRQQRSNGGGALFEVGSHVVDLWRFVLQAEIEHVHAITRSEDGDDQTTVMSARLTSGVLASAVVSQRAVDRNDFEVVGSSGRVAVDLYSFAGLDHLPDASWSGSPGSRLARAARLARSFPGGVAMARRNGSFRETYRLQWLQFLESIRRGRTIGATLDDGRRSLAAITAMVRSLEEGREIPVDRVSPDRELGARGER